MQALAGRHRLSLTLVEYDFDSPKDIANRAKHGIPLALAEVRFAGRRLTLEDDRFHYGALRLIAHLRGRLFVCVFVDRGSIRRIISLRKANSREVKRYGEKAQQGRSPGNGGDGLEQG
jgi:uncharacterized protein